VRACIFCEIVASRAPASEVLSDERFLAFLDIHPVMPGHALVIPRRHAVLLDELGDEVGDLFAFAVRVAAAARAGLGCRGVNVLLNDGAAANQTVAHAHVHVIPRRGGDLGALLGRLALRPVQPMLRPTARAELDRVAGILRKAATSPT
jgi:diadenosine tetraphosphate (Ap4A) HIT family hydrolase